MRIPLLLVALSLLNGCTMFQFRSSRLKERALGDLALVRVPGDLDPRSPETTWLGTSLTLGRAITSFSAMGSNTPYHALLVVTQVEPRQMARLGADVVRHLYSAFEHVRDPAWEPPQARGAWTLQMAEGRYTPNNLDEPSWLARALDPSRSLAVTYRVMQSKASREDVASLMDSVMSSYRLTSDLAEHFASVTRELGAGVSIAFPIELTDPFPWEKDSSGVWSMFFRRPREWAADTAMLEQTVAVATFFRPGDAAQEQVARDILVRQAAAGIDEATLSSAVRGATTTVSVTEVEHRFDGRVEPSWLAAAVDPATGVGVTHRVWKRDADREAAIALVERAMRSYRFSGDAEFFAPARQ